MKKHEKLLDVLHGTAKGLHAAKTMDSVTMREFDALCLAPVREYSAGQIKPRIPISHPPYQVALR